jgi:hypothetical protein
MEIKLKKKRHFIQMQICDTNSNGKSIFKIKYLIILKIIQSWPAQL